MLQEKFETLHGASHKRQTELEDELAQVRAYKDELNKYIRELEQVNDDLERAKRYVVHSHLIPFRYAHLLSVSQTALDCVLIIDIVRGLE